MAQPVPRSLVGSKPDVARVRTHTCEEPKVGARLGTIQTTALSRIVVPMEWRTRGSVVPAPLSLSYKEGVDVHTVVVVVLRLAQGRAPRLTRHTKMRHVPILHRPQVAAVQRCAVSQHEKDSLTWHPFSCQPAPTPPKVRKRQVMLPPQSRPVYLHRYDKRHISFPTCPCCVTAEDGKLPCWNLFDPALSPRMRMLYYTSTSMAAATTAGHKAVGSTISSAAQHVCATAKVKGID